MLLLDLCDMIGLFVYDFFVGLFFLLQHGAVGYGVLGI